MTPENFTRSLRAFALRVPFQPFLVELVSGDRFRVAHPEALALRGPVAIFIGPQAVVRLFDSASVCQLLDEGE
jgi:hypothetical protein